MGKGRGGSPIVIPWREMFGDVSGRGGGEEEEEEEVCFASSTPPRRASLTEAAAGAPRRRRTEKEEIEGMTDDQLRKEVARVCGMLPHLEGMLEDGGEGNRRRRPLLQAEARRRGIATDAESAYEFDARDRQVEYASQCFREKYSTVRSTKDNYGQLGITTRRSSRLIGQPKPIPVDKMYASKQSPSTLSVSKQRVHAIDPEEEADHEKCRQSGNYNINDSTKRRKGDSSLSSLRKVRDVVLLDDEDVQPVGQNHIWNESKIYYPSRDDPEAVELSSSDIKCLDPGVYLSSPVINFYIQYIKRTKLCDDDSREKFYIFNTYFYSKLEEALLGKGEFLKLRRWWKGVNIYHRAYIILPIHGAAHWSLIIICMPSKESNSGPIILHLDSLGIHPSAKIFGTIERYLEAEWCHLQKNPPPDTSISETIWADLPRNIHKEKVEVPQQRNEYDCGIFMLYYIEQFIRGAPERFTRDKLDMFSRSWFQSEEASDLRQRVRELLLEEFECSRLEDMSEEDKSCSSLRFEEEEDGIKGGESEAATTSDSSEIIVECGDTGINNKESKEVEASEEAPSIICRSPDKITNCVLLEAAALSDGLNDEEEDNMSIKPESDGSQNDRIIHRARNAYICDISDSDKDDVEIIEIPNRRTSQQKCLIS